jgi:hypothetical protein
MRKTILIGILVLFPAAVIGGASLASCSDVTCGTGTHEEGGKCVNNQESTCGAGTYSLGGRCIPTDGDPCGKNTVWNFDAGKCEGQSGGPVGELRGGRWTNVHMSKPESIATIANLQLPPQFADGTFVIILRTVPLEEGVSVWLHGGDGVLMTEEPLMYTFKEGFDPNPAVLTNLSPQEMNDGGAAKIPFQTASDFNMRFQFVGNATDPQPPLYIWKAKITGTLDQDGIPVANDPPLGGKLTGCFKAHGDMAANKAGAADIYITLLSQTILELIDSSGGVVDDDCDDSGSNNGFAFEIQWDSNETTDLTIDLGDAGVAPQTDAQ